jgi:hypothetical protein
MFRTESSTTPVRYYYTKKTASLTRRPRGRVESARLDMPVTYTYSKEGDRMVVTSNASETAIDLRDERNYTTTTKP